MSKIRVNLGDLYNAIERSGLVSYSENKDAMEVDLEIAEGNDPGGGAIVDTLTITLDKKERSYRGEEKSDIRMIVEVFPASRPDLNNRLTTQKSENIARAVKKKTPDDEIPF